MPPAARRQTSTAALLVQRSTEADAARPSTAEPSAPATEDIDQADRLDNRAAAEYVSHIFSYFQRVEPLYRVAPSYMAKQVGPGCCDAAPALPLAMRLTLRPAGVQTDINEKMRAILVDWLVEVHFKFKVGTPAPELLRAHLPWRLTASVWTQLLPETLYLTCSIIDRFLEKKGVLRKRLQLVHTWPPSRTAAVTSVLTAGRHAWSGTSWLPLLVTACLGGVVASRWAVR